MTGDTIFALSSGGGRAAIAVIRVSGPAAAEALTRIGGKPLPEPRRAALRRFREPATGAAIDLGLALWFPAPASASGEDMAEFHVHGGPAVIVALCDALAAIPGLRPAEPGEFTRRAFEAGRLDLTEAEGIADLVAAETDAQRRQALAQMEGGLHRLYDGWRERLMALRANVEAAIDFSDQELGEDPLAAAAPGLAALEAEVAAHLDDARRGERLREGFCIAIVGAPNAGKSSLLNRLAGRDAAIVSTRAGTTRDVVEVRLDLGGWPLTLADTAGLRESRDEIESEGMRRALARAASADLSLVVFDGALWPAADAQSLALLGDDALAVLNKTDLLAGPAPTTVAGRAALGVSCLTGAGFEALLETLAGEIARRYPTADAPALTRARHRQAVVECREALARAIAGPADERLAEELRLAAHALGRITGRVDVEAVLDLVFRDFCIGK
ncbi:MAG: tRNA uridine-5-carboxymethylaminomethyl(34) synthesis GTPase MnmE [Rhodospirillaceae bacterium]|nr:tRNA uridine-5-carboxymethylaminomethyl(34) synthesis GTPase MnmE [Rhodospirillaceae bacterium]